MSFELSEGALAAIMGGGQVENPIMQILGSKKISGAGDNERYRLLISDGLHVNSFAMLATQLNDKIRSGDLSDNTIVCIKRFITSIVPNSGRGEKRVMIILDVEVLAPGRDVGGKIGNPQTLAAEGQVPSKPSASDVRQPPTQAAPSPIRQRNPSPNRAPPVRESPQKSYNHPGSGGGFGGGYGSTIRSPDRQRGMGNMELLQNTTPHPISSLTPYQNKWVIKARVTSKSAVRHWSNKAGEGTLFSFDLVDEHGEIRVTAFKDQCEKFKDLIEVNKVYLISRAQLKTANKKFSNLNNDYEMSLTSETLIVPVDDDDGNVPQIKYNFVPLSNIETLESNAVVDVIGVVKDCGDVITIVSRASNKEFRKREVTVIDKSEVAVNITLWNDQADNFDGSGYPIIAIKGGRVNEFGGAKSVSLSQNATMQMNPDVQLAHELRGWYDSEGSSLMNIKSISQRVGGGGGFDGQLITLKEAQLQGLGSGNKADYFSCKATVLLCKSENAMYKACPGDNCLKKVVDHNNGMYRCEKCNREYPSFVPRLLLSMSIGDWSDQVWVTLFQESAEELLGCKAQDIHDKKETNSDEYTQVFQQTAFKSFQFRVRAQVQTYNDESRMKMTVANLKPIDHKAYSKGLLTQLKDLTGMSTVRHS